uniref:Uncharacterized protein n=1 Tax=Manihot esculenta TaxID=3983 RepID=A0A2C9WG45_MANES
MQSQGELIQTVTTLGQMKKRWISDSLSPHRLHV